ncbi:MAG: OsmC family protein [Bacteroidetes bacterium]|nr:OsmC family protein [Bacteroidota bacterium]
MEGNSTEKQVLTTEIKRVNQNIHFLGTAGSNKPISIDYTPPIGDGLGYTSLELLLLSLSSCVGSSVSLLLKKMNKTITDLNITANGTRRTEHPTGFEKIVLNIAITSNDVDNNAMDRALKLSEESICPVWAHLKNGVEIEINYSIKVTVQ